MHPVSASATLRLGMPRMKQVSDKNTKSEILTAYQELLSEVSVGGSPTIEQQEEKAVVTVASNKTVEKITEDLSRLKLSFAAAVNELTDRLTQEAETLATIQKAIAISKKELEETQKIKVTAGLLYRMIEAQKAREKAWAEEEKAHAEELVRTRGREEEEYQYEKQLQKKRDADQKEAERAAKEQMTTELNDLRKRVAAVPAETEKAVKDAVAKAVSETQSDAAVKAQFAKQQSDAERALDSAKIDALEATAKAQSQEIAALKKQLDEATRQVKDIAVSVIESKRPEAVFSPTSTK